MFVVEKYFSNNLLKDFYFNPRPLKNVIRSVLFLLHRWKELKRILANCEKIGSFNWKELNLYLLQSRELFGFWHLFSGLISYCHYSIKSLNYGQWTRSCFSVIFIIGKLRSTVHVFDVHIFNLLYTGHFKLVLLLVHWMLSVVCRAWTHKYVKIEIRLPLSYRYH